MRFHHGLGSALHQPIISAEMQGAPRIYFGGLKGSADLKAALFYQTTANSHTKQKHEAKRCPLLGCLVVMADGEALYFRFLLAFISSSPGIR